MQPWPWRPSPLGRLFPPPPGSSVTLCALRRQVTVTAKSGTALATSQAQGRAGPQVEGWPILDKPQHPPGGINRGSLVRSRSTGTSCKLLPALVRVIIKILKTPRS